MYLEILGDTAANGKTYSVQKSRGSSHFTLISVVSVCLLACIINLPAEIVIIY